MSPPAHPPTGVFRTVRSRMLFWTLAVVVPIYLIALYMSYQATAHRLEIDAERDADELATRLAAGIDAVVRPLEGSIRTVAGQLEAIDPPREQYIQRIRGILGVWPNVYGSSIAVEVGAPGAGAGPFAPYLFRRDGNIDYSDLARDSYSYRNLAWYRQAADSLRPVWSLPYFDAGGGETWMVTYSVPFFRDLPSRTRVLAGVVTADLDLDWVRHAATNVKLGPIGMGWLYAPPGSQSFIAPIGATSNRLQEFAAGVPEAALRDVAERMLANGTGFARLPRGISSEAAYLAVRNLETLNWRVMFVVPRAQLLAEARQLLNRQLWLGAAGMAFLIAAISIVAAGISRPLHALAVAVGTTSDDQLDFRLPDRSPRDEIGVLTHALRRMRDSLQTHIQLRAESLAAQARLEHELEIAASIQQSMLPRHGSRHLPAAAKVAAALLPAKHVGGDLYDYFQVRDDHLLFAIGDVSDKGIPAALFMARLSGLLRVLGTGGELPHRLLTGINAKLCEGNDACMFVTLGCGLLNLKTGQVRYASAGHEPPLLRTAEGTVRSMVPDNGPAIGIEMDADYQLVDSFIAPGDTLVLFTDGVTEAEADDSVLFGIERLGSLLSDQSDGEPATLVQRIVDTVAAHACNSFRSTDDLTVLAIGLHPPDVTVQLEGPTPRWTIQPHLSGAGVRQTQLWMHAILAARDIAAERIGDVELIVEEVLTNIVRALADRDDPQLSLECLLTADSIVLTSRDNGPQFDPLARAAPDLDADIVDRDIGGLGILIVTQLADRCDYSHVDGRNVLKVRLRRSMVS